MTDEDRKLLISIFDLLEELFVTLPKGDVANTVAMWSKLKELRKNIGI